MNELANWVRSRPRVNKRRGVALAAFWLLLSQAVLLRAADTLLNFDYDPLTAVLTLSLPRDPQSYYTLEWTEDFQSFRPVGLSLGDPAPVWAYSIADDSPRGFFRVRARSLFSPLDSDGDGIDDRYELQHPGCLDPLNYFDASKPCLTLGLSNYQVYLRELFGAPGVALQFFSRETTVFNFGQPSANREAISQEISVYNANPGSGPPQSDIPQVYSREVTTWNFGSPSARLEAISAEISVYNANPGSGPPQSDIPQVYSREVTTWNFGSPSARLEAISPELTVFNFGQASARVEAISRELTILNFEEPTQP